MKITKSGLKRKIISDKGHKIENEKPDFSDDALRQWEIMGHVFKEQENKDGYQD